MFFRGFYAGEMKGVKAKKANRVWSRLAFGAELYFNLVRSLFWEAGFFFNATLIVRFE
jgi:hypothetical protein